MNAEFFRAIEQVEKEKGIPKDYMFEKITQALITAYKRDNPGTGESIFVDVDPVKEKISMYVTKKVVDDVYDPDLEISLDEARTMSAKYKLDDIVRIEIDTKDFGRIAAQTAKQHIRSCLGYSEQNTKNGLYKADKGKHGLSLQQHGCHNAARKQRWQNRLIPEQQPRYNALRRCLRKTDHPD